MKTRPAALVAALFLASCFGSDDPDNVVYLVDLEVGWTLDGQQNAALCTQYGIAQWRVNMSGPEVLDVFDFACGTFWNSGQSYYGIAEGNWNITVSALDGAGTVLATQTQARQLAYDPTTVWTVDFPFTSADFTPPANASLIVAWKISGTVDGSDQGASWDTCDEVGAVNAAVTVNGTTTTYPCAANSMSTTITDLEAGTYTVSVVLEDGQAAALTTAVARDLVASTTPAQEPFLFTFDAFLDPLKIGTNGDYLYETVFESQSNPLTCASTNPVAGQRLVLLTLEGDVIDAESCPSAGGAVCTPTDASGFGTCVDGQKEITELRWGMYKIKLQAAPVSSTTVCWQAETTTGANELDIIVGAGTVNPVDQFVLERLSDTGDCAPTS